MEDTLSFTKAALAVLDALATPNTRVIVVVRGGFLNFGVSLLGGMAVEVGLRGREHRNPPGMEFQNGSTAIFSGVEDVDRLRGAEAHVSWALGTASTDDKTLQTLKMVTRLRGEHGPRVILSGMRP